MLSHTTMTDQTNTFAEPDSETAGGADAYETDDGTVIYDIDRPLAWIQGDNAVELRKMH